jgi:hypothetical protein
MVETKTDGIQIDFIGSERLDRMGSAQKSSEILESVVSGKIVVLEGGLTPQEESHLIEDTMGRVQPDGFTGIEIESHGRPQSDSGGGLMSKLLGKSDSGKKSSLTVIGPADKVETLNKKENLLSTLVRE